MSAAAEMERLRKLMEQQEELDPALALYHDEERNCIQHPLVYSVLHVPALNAMMNNALRVKTEEVREAKAEKNWHRYVYLHERPHRLPAFTRIMENLRHREYWELLGSIWTDSENIWQNADEWRECLTDTAHHGRSYMMDDDEREALAALPDDFEVWRGYHVPEAVHGFSWTLERERAEWFAKRLLRDDREAHLAHGWASKADVIAHFTCRSEAEIVIDPERLSSLSVTVL